MQSFNTKTMAKKQQPQILSPENYIRQRAHNLPIFKCYINEGWDDVEMAQVTVARKHINGNFTYCSYMVDLQCLGVKDTMFDFNISEEQFDEFVGKMSQGFELIEVDYVLVHNIIHAGGSSLKRWVLNLTKIFSPSHSICWKKTMTRFLLLKFIAGMTMVYPSMCRDRWKMMPRPIGLSVSWKKM